jgi:nitrate reductase delta subunit
VIRRRARPRERPPYALLSYLLRYPEDGLSAAGAEIGALADGPVRAALERFLAEAGDGDPRARYVETFDMRRRVTLHLTYYEHGDTRRRGVAMLWLKRIYREAGLPLADGELPDHLAVMLAFAALAPEGCGEAVLAEHRPALELLRLALHDAGSPYRHVLDALVADLPPLGVEDRADVARLAAEGPPAESVGLEPFAPPEVMPAGARP